MGRDHWTSGPQGKAHEIEKQKHAAGNNNAKPEGVAPTKDAASGSSPANKKQDHKHETVKYDPINMREAAGGRKSLDNHHGGHHKAEEGHKAQKEEDHGHHGKKH